MKRIHLIIGGDVQGVGFRAWVLRQAQDSHVNGWVKNREDGAVEIVAEGQKEALEELVITCKKGPEVAWVKDVRVSWEQATSEFVGFEVVY